MAKNIPIKTPESERLTEEILDVILNLAALNFTKTVKVGYDDTSFNAVAAGLNMLGQELQRSVVSKEYVNNIISSMSDALVVLNPDHTLRTINDYTNQLLHYQPDELIGQPANILFASNEDLAVLFPASGAVLKSVEAHFVTKDKKVIPMQIHRSILTDHNNDVSGILLVARDMSETLRLIKELEDAHDHLEQQVAERTKELSSTNQLLATEIDIRKNAEAQAKAGEQRYRAIFEGTSVSLWEADLSEAFDYLNRSRKTRNYAGSDVSLHADIINESLSKIKFIDINDATIRMFEAENKDTLLQNINKCFTEDSNKAFMQMLIELSGKSDYFETECTVLTLKGKLINVLVQVRRQLGTADNPRYLISIVNMTTVRQLEEQLRQSQKMESIGRLAGGIAHDFNNLLTVILNYGQMVGDELSESDPVKRKVDAIVESAERAASLTHQLLAFSRRQMITPKIVDLNGILSNMEKMLQRLLGEDVDLVTKLDPNLTKVQTDISQLEQIVMNLAVNARDAMPNGGKLIISTQNVTYDETNRADTDMKPGRYAMISVMDTGEGMPEDIQTRIFEPFFTTKGIGKGTGLGLSTVYGNVKQNGGYITVKSQIKKGSTFNVFLPSVDQTGAEIDSVPEPREQSSMGTETILVVEDEDSVRGVACALLRNHGYKVIEARSPGEALLISEQQAEPIDLMLTDVVMPNMNGRALSERLAKVRPDMRVLYMSGYTDNAITHNGVLEARTAFLQKPFTRTTLIAKIQEVLQESEPKEVH